MHHTWPLLGSCPSQNTYVCIKSAPPSLLLAINPGHIWDNLIHYTKILNKNINFLDTLSYFVQELFNQEIPEGWREGSGCRRRWASAAGRRGRGPGGRRWRWRARRRRRSLLLPAATAASPLGSGTDLDALASRRRRWWVFFFFFG